jgi:phage antirepressor YoqD-like protein
MLNFITEPNLYKCIFQSRKKEAEQFQDWVCTEVLPAIRKQGGYIAVGKNDDEFTILSKAVLIANSQIEKLKNQNTVLQEKINTDAPKVLFADAVATSDKSILIGELAKIITQNGVNIGQKRLFEWMRENGYLCSRGEMYNIPTQYAMNLGLFEIKKVAIQKPNGSSIVNTTPKVTVKGQIYFLDKYLSLHRDLLKNY